jgi:serine/threonine protein kinase
LDLLFKGGNGFALKFVCENGNTYTIKLLYNNEQMSGKNVSFPTFEKREKPKICNEFTSINRFHSIYIMKAYKYFLYDKNQFILSSECNVPRRTDIQYIQGDSEKQIVNFEGRLVNPMFSGLILEYIQHGISDILSMSSDILTKENIIRLFLNYLYGLKTISDNFFIHKDIKLNNLMFNINPDKTVIGKIIDFGETFEFKNVFNLDNNIMFSPSSTEYAPMQSDYPELRRIYDGSFRRSLTTAQQAIIDEIRTKYDLYSLSKSFKNDLIPHIKGIDFSDFIELVLTPSCNENFKDRLDLEDAIGLTLSLLV